MEKIENCTSCGIRLMGSGTSMFPCPSCGVTTIARCRKCRDQSVRYKCSNCRFRGP